MLDMFRATGSGLVLMLTGADAGAPGPPGASKGGGAAGRAAAAGRTVSVASIYLTVLYRMAKPVIGDACCNT